MMAHDPVSLATSIATKISLDAETGCHNWTGRKSRLGYGRIKLAGRLIAAHRVVYEALRGPIPVGLELDHLCRNHACCNPEHLEPVTHAENVRRGAAHITHCPQGHEYTPENTMMSRGWRNCRICGGERSRRRRRETYIPKSPKPIQTECKRGHPLSGDNLVPRKDARRQCRACVDLRSATRNEARKQARALARSPADPGSAKLRREGEG